MAYIEKFKYHQLSRQTVDGSRRYLTPDGDRVPSVTTILDATKPEEARQALNEWRRRVGTEKAQAITTEAANRGTKMHSYLEWYIRDGEIKPPPPNPFHRPSWHMAQRVIDLGLANCQEFWGIEVPVYFPGVYAGTTDCVGVQHNSDSIIDFKQSNKPKKREWIDDYFLQLCAYAEAHNEVYNTKIRRGVVMMCVKPLVDEQYNLIQPPEYQEFVIEGADFERYRSQWWHRVEQYYNKK